MRRHVHQRVWEWKAEYGGKITNQIRKLGSSVDWSREAFTMDANLSRASPSLCVSCFPACACASVCVCVCVFPFFMLHAFCPSRSVNAV